MKASKKSLPFNGLRESLAACAFSIVLLAALILACEVGGNANQPDTVGKAFSLVTQSPGEIPVADAGADLRVIAWHSAVFNGSGSTDDIGIVNYTWTFVYDDENQTLYNVRPEFKFYTPGTYVVTLNVTDADGNHDTDTVTVVVEKNFLMKYWTALLIGALIIVALAQLVVIMRKKEFVSPKVVATYGVLGALTAAITMATYVPFAPTKGYFNVGDSMVFFSALAFGWRTAGICGGFGSAAADILLGSGFFAPLTLIAKGSEGLVSGAISRMGGGGKWPIVFGVAAGGICMVLSYFFGELLLLNVGMGAALLEAVGNVLQVVVGGTIGVLLTHSVKRAYPALTKT
jgi:uncharacterized membrane protein